ncbi:MAG TPA: DUF2182 domain-containing protein [Candidatus Sulfotelmatobacter sp.]|nr:DUF2182 domain-containing protein [Candidatus Sulfotelmatobacter sp.]
MQHRLVAAQRLNTPHVTPFWWLVALGWVGAAAMSLSGSGAVVRHDRLIVGGPPLWAAVLVFLAGWQVMLWAMMLAPSLGVIDRAGERRRQLSFTLGYLAVWTAFGLAAFFFDIGIHAIAAHSPWLALHPWVIAGAILMVAGVYQLSDIKTFFLDACRFAARDENQVASGGGALVRGCAYGLNCLGANWALMLLAFALAGASLAAMAGITLLMILEVVRSTEAWVVKVSGHVLIICSAFVLVGPIVGPLWIG